MDSLIRKVNGDNEIEGLNIGINGECIDKVCGYADDIVLDFNHCLECRLSKIAILFLRIFLINKTN